MGEDEYEVESILCARVTKKTPRSKQLVWNYHVKWKGYENPEDNTWEPAESFSGSEHFVEDFWKKVDTGGRDVENLKLFKEGEKLIPPESRKSRKPSKKPKEVDEHDLTSARSGKRKRSLGETGETTIPNKRVNTRTSRNSRKGRHEQSPVELQPDPLVEPEPEQEEKERAFSIENQSDSEGSPTPTDEKPPRYRKRTNLTPPTESSTQATENKSSSDVLADKSQPSISSHLPAHRARTANPLVKMMDDDINMEDTISTKARLFPQREKQPTNNEAPGHAQPSGGESSITTSPYYTPLTGSPDKPVITFRSKEPLYPVGRDDEALEDEEDNMERDTNSSDLRTNNSSESLFQQSLSLAKDKLFPSSFTSASQSISSAISAAWKRSTIFSPLTSGSYQPHPAVRGNGEDSPSQTFILNLGVTVSLPVALMAPTTSNSPEPELVVSNNSNNPPGKFYSREAALAVLGTLRTGGPCAMVTHGPQCDEAQKDTFRQFSDRLSNDQLFLAMAGTDVLAFCSSASLLIFQKLNFPPLLGSSGAVVVKRVTIQDHSAYATAALQA
ncbi:hypothetical protein L218DRAFT_140977 [Marasmius fiardii PR-910]|nr:hypothetical protein L218DRAFT_140977 [Marasmius fiardii PR-910]